MKMFNLSLDLTNETNNQPVIFRVGEKGGGFHVKYTESGNPVNLNGLKIKFAMNTPSPFNGAIYDSREDAFIITDGANGQFDYYITEAALKNAGRVINAHFVLLKEDVEVANYVEFEFIILPDINIQNPASYYFSEIEELMAYLKNLIESDKSELIENISEIQDKYNELKLYVDDMVNLVNANGAFKKAGDTLSGDMIIDTSKERAIRGYDASTSKYVAGIAFNNTGFSFSDWFNNKRFATYSTTKQTLDFLKNYLTVGGSPVVTQADLQTNTVELFNGAVYFLSTHQYTINNFSKLKKIRLWFSRYTPGTGAEEYGFHKVVIEKSDINNFTSKAFWERMPSGDSKKAFYLSSVYVKGADANGSDPDNLYALRRVEAEYEI